MSTEPGTVHPSATRAATRLVEGLAGDVGSLPRYRQRPLFRQRQNPDHPSVLGPVEVRDRFARVVRDLCALGYFEDAFGSECDDARDDPAACGQRVLAERLHVDVALWPLHEWRDGEVVISGVHESWSEEVFFEVIEALDEVVARPRRRYWHSFHAGWDYSDYARVSGQAVYRWQVNEVLGASALPYRLAVSGEDAGWLVRSAGDPRDELLELALKTPELAAREEVAHATALFRARRADRQAKRSAVVTLAGVLESRRDLLEGALDKKHDIGPLFHIANKFDLRHRGADQHPDYDEAYLDWIFWWYLATEPLSVGR